MPAARLAVRNRAPGAPAPRSLCTVAGAVSASCSQNASRRNRLLRVSKDRVLRAQLPQARVAYSTCFMNGPYHGRWQGHPLPMTGRSALMIWEYGPFPGACGPLRELRSLCRGCRGCRCFFAEVLMIWAYGPFPPSDATRVILQLRTLCSAVACDLLRTLRSVYRGCRGFFAEVLKKRIARHGGGLRTRAVLFKCRPESTSPPPA